MTENSSTHPTTGNSLDNDFLYSHTNSIGHYTDFALESWQGKVQLLAGPTDSDISVLISGNVLISGSMSETYVK